MCCGDQVGQIQLAARLRRCDSAECVDEPGSINRVESSIHGADGALLFVGITLLNHALR